MMMKLFAILLVVLFVRPSSSLLAPLQHRRALARPQGMNDRCSLLMAATPQADEQSSTTKTNGDEAAADTETSNPRLEGLALLLDDGTRKSHSMAENTAFVSGFFKGVSTKEAYGNLITSLYFVYEAMETCMDESSSSSREVMQALDDPALRRLRALKKDMEYFYGSEWKDKIRPSPATQAYVNRIKEVAASKNSSKNHLLIGHLYSRYLGDLFGGQMMKTMAARSLNLENGNGVAFYQFDDIDDTKAYISDWYKRLNSLDLTDAQKEQIVDEANLVFALNIGIFNELEGSSIRALWTMGVNTLKLKLGMA